MLVTRRVDTALRILIYLASQRGGERYLKARQIERDLNLPPFALRKILWTLARGGLVRSLPGRDGGFRLGRTPEEISIAEVLASLEGRLRAFPCRGVREDCEWSGRCGVAPIYQEVEAAVERLLRRYSIQDCLAGALAHPAQRGA